MKENKNYLYFLILIFFLSFFAIVSNGRYGGDGLENYLTAESIVLNQSLSIYDKPFDVKEMKYEALGQVDASGKRYSASGIGMPLLLVPLYFIGHVLSKVVSSVPHDYITQFFVSFSNPIIIALTAVSIFVLLLRLGFNKAASFLTIGCYGFCTMSSVYARSGFSEPAIGLLVVLAVLFLHSYEEKGTVINIVIVTCLAGYAVLIKNNSLLYVPLLLGYLLYKSIGLSSIREKLSLWASICVPLTVFAILYIYFHHLMGGFTAGKSNAYQVVVERAIPECFQMLKGLVYYVCSAGKGYFFYNFPLLLSLFGIRGLMKKRTEFTIFLISIVLINFLFYSFRFERGSIFSWGPRYLYPTVPIMCIFFAEFIEDSKTLARKVWTWIFLAIGFFVQIPSMLISSSNYLLFVKEQLGQQEYLINYIPDLSPIRGVWSLLISAIGRTLTGRSMDFIYNPDRLFVLSIKKSMENYDVWDIWWAHAIKISPKLFPVLIAAIVILSVSALLCFVRIRLDIKK